MADLSSAAQVILKAAYKATRNPKWQTNFYASYAAAALRAAADQVVPQEPWHARLPTDHHGWYSRQRYMTRSKLLAIAAELEAQTEPQITYGQTQPHG